MKKIDLLLLDTSVFEVKENEKGYYFSINGIDAKLPPHVKARQLNTHEVISFFVDHLDSLAINILAAYLYDLVRNKKARNVKVDDKSVETVEEIKEKLSE